MIKNLSFIATTKNNQFPTEFTGLLRIVHRLRVSHDYIMFRSARMYFAICNRANHNEEWPNRYRWLKISRRRLKVAQSLRQKRCAVNSSRKLSTVDNLFKLPTELQRAITYCSIRSANFEFLAQFPGERRQALSSVQSNFPYSIVFDKKINFFRHRI